MPLQEVKEGLQEQSADETIIWEIECAEWASAPSSPSVESIVSESDGVDQSAKLSGSPSFSGTVLSLPSLSGLVAGETYRIEVTFSDGQGNTLECYMRVRCKF